MCCDAAISGNTSNPLAANHDGSYCSSSDPFDLRARFAETYRRDFGKALSEIKAGRKEGHWSWYIFPAAPWVVDGIEHGTTTNRYYALRDKPPHDLRGDDAARAFLRFHADNGVSLRSCYLTMMQAISEKLQRG